LKGRKTIMRNFTARSAESLTEALKKPTINIHKAGSMADQTI
jgi:hypothetical protein